MGSFALLSAGMGGLATLYLLIQLLLVAITLLLLATYAYSSNRTIAQVCYVVALTIVFPGVACIGNSASIPPDYVGGFLELLSAPLQAFEPDAGSLSNRIVTFFFWLPIPTLVALVVAAPVLRRKLIVPRGRPPARK
jgi:hypothetical protein